MLSVVPKMIKPSAKTQQGMKVLLQVMLTPIFILHAHASNLSKEIVITKVNIMGDIRPPCLTPRVQIITSSVHELLEMTSFTLTANFMTSLAVNRSTPACNSAFS
eukprot:912918-Heterocapsa_arctica.AAC.1